MRRLGREASATKVQAARRGQLGRRLAGGVRLTGLYSQTAIGYGQSYQRSGLDAPPSSPVQQRFAGMSDEDQVAYAIHLIKRAVQRRKMMLSFQAVVQAAKENFLDRRAIESGASGTAFYSDAALTIRQALADDRQVAAALDDMWGAISSATGRQWVTRSEYEIMSRKLYLSIKVRGVAHAWHLACVRVRRHHVFSMAHPHPPSDPVCAMPGHGCTGGRWRRRRRP